MKRIKYLIVLAMVAIMLIGCSGEKVTNKAEDDNTSAVAKDDVKEDDKEAAKAEPIEIKIMSRWSDDQPRSVLFRKRIDEFNAQNNGIKIVADHINDEPAYLDKLRTSFATGDVPNLYFGYGGAREYEYIINDAVLDLTQAFKDNPDWYNSFSPLFDKWQYSDIEGTYGAPAEFYAITMSYNKDIFNELGLTPPTTIEEFEKVSDELLANGYIPMALGAKDTWRIGHIFNNLFMKAYGSKGVEQLADRSLSYDSKEVIDILAKIKTYNDKGYFGPNAISLDYNAEKTLFFEGKSAMHMDGSWYLGEAALSPIAESIGVIPFPYTNEEFKGTWFGSAAGFSVTTNTDKEIEAASIEVLKFLTDKQFFLDDLTGSAGGVYPVKFSDEEIKDIKISTPSKEFLTAIATATEFRDDIQTYDKLPSMLDTCRSTFQGLFAGRTPEECAADIIAEIKSRE